MEIDAYDTPIAEEVLRAREGGLQQQQRERRALLTNATAAISFLSAATLLAVLSRWQCSLSPLNLALVVATWVTIERVKFPVAGYWTYPTMLALVPALFLLPTPVVPLVAMVAICFRAVPGIVRGRLSPRMLLTTVADSWFTIGPALVVVVGGAATFSWSQWPVYLCAVVAQVALDLVISVAWIWFGERSSPWTQLPLLSWIYLVDATLWPLGLLVAAAAVTRPGLILVSLSPAAMLYFFARERTQRLEHSQALSTAYRGTALLLGDVVEADDNYTGTHSRDVVDLSVQVAQSLHLKPAQRRDVEFGALLHDVGKIRIPKEIINKPGPLNEAEWAIVRRHTIEGEMMLKQVGGTLSRVGSIVRATHERYDGGGYPDGLAGSDIPIESRIITVCDSFSAMTTDRPYRPKLSEYEAIAELQRCAGTQFDPRVVAVLARLVRGWDGPRPLHPLAVPQPLAVAASG